jgi:hypothetical protein
LAVYSATADVRIAIVETNLEIRLSAAAAAPFTTSCAFSGTRGDLYGSVRGTVTDDTGHPIASARLPLLASIRRNTIDFVFVSSTSAIDSITMACDAFGRTQRARLSKKSFWEAA